MQRLLLLLLLSVTGIACVRNRAGAIDSQLKRDCPRVPGADAVTIDSVPLERLAGRFRLIMIDTANPQLSPTVDHLELRPPDRAFLEMLDNAQRTLALMRPSAPARSAPPLFDHRPNSALWMAERTGMSEGECIGICSDSSPTYFGFTYLSPAVVRGVWSNAMTGIAIMVDPVTNRRLPPPGGYFCMLRE